LGCSCGNKSCTCLEKKAQDNPQKEEKKEKKKDDRRENWMPLESNPDVLNPYIKELGFDTSKYCFYDVLSVESWAGEMIPAPCLAVMFLFPLKPAFYDYYEIEKAQISEKGQKIGEGLFYMK